jgi:hypothetical protein
MILRQLTTDDVLGHIGDAQHVGHAGGLHEVDGAALDLRGQRGRGDELVALTQTHEQ